jgi:hypothetical protein
MKFGFFQLQLRATPIGRRADLPDEIWKIMYTENTMSSYREYMVPNSGPNPHLWFLFCGEFFSAFSRDIYALK